MREPSDATLSYRVPAAEAIATCRACGRSTVCKPHLVALRFDHRLELLGHAAWCAWGLFVIADPTPLVLQALSCHGGASGGR